MANSEFVQGIFDTDSCILTISSKFTRSFKVGDQISQLESHIRIERLTTWAREQLLISDKGIIAEI
ncbi:Uncharacterised protein [Shewanella morhuae]|uniref:Uncharacterized protein n=1 Tax=Shewanella morhuae TaxID=365591 RepID=A0A380BVM0_9GAMM|nr:Uncharacterised protein [Shewanella morhuae]